MLRIALLVFVLACVLVLSVGTVALAQGADDESDARTAGRLFDHFVVGGGAITWFILIPLSIATVALIIEHSFSIRRGTILPDTTVNRIRDNLASKRYVDAVKFTANERSVLASAVNSGLVEAPSGFAAMRRATEEDIDESAWRMMRKIEYLNIIGNVGPLIGLFGTVYGMIGLFASIFEAGGIPEPARIAQNISIALVTTFWGLLIAIPALSAFAFFRNRIDALTTECTATADNLLSAFEPAQVGDDAAPVAQERLAS